MAYTSQTFTNGQVLTATHLNRMNEGIVAAVSTDAQTLTEDQKAQARENIGVSAEGLSDDAKTLLISVLRKALYLDDASREIYQLRLALGLPEWETVRVLTSDDISYGVGLRSANPYYYNLVIRASYTKFDIPVEYGYTYKVKVESTVDTAQFALQVYTAAQMEKVAAGEDYGTGNMDSGWRSGEMEYTPTSNDRTARFVFRMDTNNSSVTNGFITKVTISRKAVQQ